MTWRGNSKYLAQAAGSTLGINLRCRLRGTEGSPEDS